MKIIAYSSVTTSYNHGGGHLEKQHDNCRASTSLEILKSLISEKRISKRKNILIIAD